MPRITHHGAVEGVTGSCHQLQLADGASVLVDCGLFQGAETSGEGAGSQQMDIRFPLQGVQALVVTHVHIDHVGRIPYLLSAGFSGPILCSTASAHLLPLVLEDALKVGFTRDANLVERVLAQLRRQIVALPYGRWHVLYTGAAAALRVKLHPAGHILGSAYVEFDAREGAQATRVVFSGDLGAPYTPLLPAPKSPYGADILVLESTYGDRRHEDRRYRRARLKALVEKALRDKGTLLIPAFSIGRTQELLYELERIIHDHGHRPAAPGVNWADLDIIVDSPLAADFTAGYQSLRAHWDAEAKKVLAAGRHPLAFEQLTTVPDHATHQKLVSYLAGNGRPAVVIAASGMCAGGRIVNYLKAMLANPRNDVLFLGYQAAGTPGRDIQTYGPKGGYVDLDGIRIQIRAGIHTLGGYSAHADQKDLLNFIARMRKKPRQIRLVHGDAPARQTLADEIRQRWPEIELVTGRPT
ncbi:MAG: MBL fold metallo-hydrolase [Pseudomonadota bacterium]